MGIAFLIVIVVAAGISLGVGTTGLQDIIPSILEFIDTYLIPFLLGIAFLLFIWNAIKYFVVEGATEEGREDAKNLALYSVAAFVFILSFWGLVNLLIGGIGFDNCSNDIVPDYLGEDYSSSAPCVSPRPPARPSGSGNFPIGPQ